MSRRAPYAPAAPELIRNSLISGKIGAHPVAPKPIWRLF